MFSFSLMNRFPLLGCSRWRRLAGLLLCVVLWAVSTMAVAVNVNTATNEQLQQVKGIGPKTAALIVEERERGGVFKDLQDLQERVKGIGAKRAQSLQQGGLKVEESLEPSAVPAATP